MPKKTIVLVKGDEYTHLEYEDEVWEGEIIKNYDPSLEELADFCDQNAESGNNYAFCGSHRILAALLHKTLGREQATKVMLGIAEYGGLDGMSGVGGGKSAYADFGIKEPWWNWKLPLSLPEKEELPSQMDDDVLR